MIKVAEYHNADVASDEFFDNYRRSRYWEPEKQLLMALMLDAVHCYRKYRAERDPTAKKQFRDARGWLMSPGKAWVFSFENVCEFLNIDPAYVRSGLLRRSHLGRVKAKRVAHAKTQRLVLGAPSIMKPSV